jgi:hypothetical protein
MSNVVKYLVLPVIWTGAVAASAAPAAYAFPPVGGASASDTIRDLQAQGYDVGINWIGGNTTAALSECAVSAIHNPDHSTDGLPPGTFTTVYVDVVCPNNDDAGGLGIGAQVG